MRSIWAKTYSANNQFTKLLFGILLLLSMNSVSADGLRTAAPKDAHLYFIDLQDGDTVKSPLLVRFGLSGMGVAPAGVEQKHTGHHHLLLNLEDMPDMEIPLPSTENIVHFGKGQTETTIELTEGTHTLQLLLGNHYHVPHNPPVMSDKITIIIK